METIIILSDNQRPSVQLVALLSELFPECDIHIVSKGPKEEE
jgi:hypothetical protein